MSEHVIKAARYSIIIFFLMLVSGFTGYFIRVAIAKNLSVAEYGLFYSVFTLFNFFALFIDTGLSQGAINKIVKYRVEQNFSAIKNLALSILYLQSLLAVVFSALIFIFQSFLAENYYHADISGIIIPFCLYFIVMPITFFVVNIVYGFGKSVIQSAFDAIKNIFILFGALAGFYLLSKSILVPAYAYLFSSLFVLILSVPIFLKLFPGFFKLRFRFVPLVIWDTFKYGIYVTLATLGWTIITQTDTLMLTYYSTLETVGIYQVAVPIAMVLFFFAGAIGAAIYPLFSEFEAKNEFHKLSELTTLIYAFIEMAVLPAAAVFFIYPDLIINTLFGPKFLAGTIVIQIFAAATPLMILGNINYIILAAIGKAKVAFKAIFFSAVLNILLNFILIPRYDITGAAVSSVIAFSSLFVFSIIQLQRFYAFKIPYLRFVKIIFSSAVFLLCIHLLKQYLELSNPWIEIIIVLGISGVIYAGLLFATKTVNLYTLKVMLRMARIK